MAPGNKEINYRYSLNLILQDVVLLDMESDKCSIMGQS